MKRNSKVQANNKQTRISDLFTPQSASQLVSNRTEISQSVEPNSLTDISPIGSEWRKQSFSKTAFPKDKDGRSFKPHWIDSYQWIEYSESMDAVFCYVCRHFGAQFSNCDIFMKAGFKNWKMALTKNKGFDKHNQSEQHIHNVAIWKEKEMRDNSSKGISHLLSNDVIQKRQYYVKSLIGVVKFLASNELPFRGDWNPEAHTENGLFSNLMEYTVETDDKLKQCLSSMPKNASYTSPEIQNELIEIMAKLV